MFARIASGSARGSPAYTFVPAWIALLSSASTSSAPSGSMTRVTLDGSVTVIGSWIATTLYVRTGAPDGQIPSLRLAHGSMVFVGSGAASAVSPRYGAPEWMFGANGGRLPTCGRRSGQAGRPFSGLNSSLGRLPT